MATLLYSSNFIGSTLERLWPETVMAKEIPLADIAEYFTPGVVLSSSDLLPSSGVHHSHYQMNQPRNFIKDFQFLADEEIQSIEIVDRYLFALDHNTAALEKLLDVFSDMWKSRPDQIKLTYGPAGNPQEDQAWRNAAFNLVVALQKNPKLSGISILPMARSYREPKGDKHDRRICVQSRSVTPPVTQITTGRRQRSGPIKQPKPVRKTFVAELTGGVSHLMDVGFETNVFSWVK